ncbi:MAG: type II toxin-antitoxin system HigB family toxin [Candidatus Melainabacteria bacterium HGW-Melainabacteria-1]|nr:MAG: type II toxin-antitoxin system HigB family toxin [Candidatus Melainabacteria bacterium HGW-Melainabacteria-1]
MKLRGVRTLEKFKKKHADVSGPLNAWRAEVEAAQWEGPQAVKERFPHASILADNRIIFNIKGNHYRLVVQVRYVNQLVMIEWIGTHAEYDKKTFG